MRKGNSEPSAELVQRIEKARDLLGEALALVQKTKGKSQRLNETAAVKARVKPNDIDFSLPIRAFVKKYGTKMSGGKKFALLIAYLTQGDSAKSVTLAEIIKHWNKLTSKGLLGMKFNPLYTSQAKENDWANTKAAGSYHLRPSWKDIFA